MSDDLEQRVIVLEQEVEAIKARNARVDSNKAWETSWARIFSIIIITYTLTSLVFWLIGVERYFVSAIIPTIGFFLSTQTLPRIKKIWVARR
jgi:hypothetical protein